jgi:hypothetical protein
MPLRNRPMSRLSPAQIPAPMLNARASLPWLGPRSIALMPTASPSVD